MVNDFEKRAADAGGRILIEFNCAQAARDYRHAAGCGGWIFSPENKAEKTVLFPPGVYPAEIFNHPITKGRAGDLIGAS